MKVVFLDTTMEGNLIGGAHTFLVRIMQELSRRGHQVDFITKGKPRAKTAANIENSGARIHPEIWNPTLLVDDAAPILADWINQLNPDVYVVSVSPDIGWAVLPYLDSNIATLTIGHNDSETFYEPARHYSGFLTKAVGVSSEICRNYVEKCRLPAENVRWIPYGVESRLHQITDHKLESEPLSIVYVGRLEDEQKRASDLIKITKRLVEEKINFEFKVIGDGDLTPLFEAELKSEITQQKVFIPGWVKNEELLDQLCRSEVFLLTSAYEGFCISLIEAMANGCCPVATEIESGNQQLIRDGENGYLVPVGDIEKFVERVKFLENHRESLLTMRQEALQTGRQYSIDKMVDSYLQCFAESIASTKISPRQPDPNFPLMESCRSKYPLWLRRLKAKTLQYVSAV